MTVMYYGSKCIHLPTEIVELDGVRYYTADRDNVSEFLGDLVVNLTGMPNVPLATQIPHLAPHFDIAYKEIVVPWPDYEVPRVRPTFWLALHEFIKQNLWTEICFHCMHAHGRTGTAMSAMLVAIGGYSAKDAVELVRAFHCEDSVESPQQCHYLLEIDKHYNNREPSTDNYPVSTTMLTRVSTNQANNKQDDKDIYDVSGTNWGTS